MTNRKGFTNMIRSYSLTYGKSHNLDHSAPWHAKDCMFAASFSQVSVVQVFMHARDKNQQYFQLEITKETGQSCCCRLAFSENRLTRTNEQNRSIKACSMREFWCGCKESGQTIKKNYLIKTVSIIIWRTIITTNLSLLFDR